VWIRQSGARRPPATTMQLSPTPHATRLEVLGFLSAISHVTASDLHHTIRRRTTRATLTVIDLLRVTIDKPD